MLIYRKYSALNSGDFRVSLARPYSSHLSPPIPATSTSTQLNIYTLILECTFQPSQDHIPVALSTIRDVRWKIGTVGHQTRIMPHLVSTHLRIPPTTQG